METAKLIIWGQRNAVVSGPGRVSSLSWYFLSRDVTNKEDLFRTFRAGQKDPVGWLSGLTEKEIKLMLIRFAYGLLGNPKTLLPSELLADAGLEYGGGIWVDTWDRKQTFETIWQTIGRIRRPPDRKIVLGGSTPYLRIKEAEYRKPPSERRIVTPSQRPKRKKGPIIVVPSSGGGARYRKEKKKRKLNLREVFAAAREERLKLENLFTDDECFYILEPEKYYVQAEKISTSGKTSRAKKTQGQRKL